jgi:putative transcriptional regulator
MAVRSRLKEFMESKDLTQQEVAGRTGLSPTIVNRLYHNRFSRLDNGTVETICRYFQVELGQMFYIEVKDGDC